MVDASILLPTFFPDVNYLFAVQNSQRTILIDTLPFNRKSRVHRGKIRDKDGVQWITLPISPDQRSQPLSAIEIKNGAEWSILLEKKLQTNYGNSIYFDFFKPEILHFFMESLKEPNFARAAEQFTRFILSLLEIKWNPIFSSDFGTTDTTFKLLDKIAVTNFIMEPESKRYLPPVQGATEISVPQISYTQHFDGYYKNCCVLDILFNLGPESFTVLDSLSET